MGESVMPHSIELEQALLGILLLDSGSRPKIKPVLNPDDFYQESHGDIYSALIGSDGDSLVIGEKLRRQGKLDDIGGQQYLFDLAIAVNTIAGLERYAKELFELSRQRRLIQTLQTAGDDALKQKDFNAVVGDVRQKLRDIDGEVEKERTSLDVLQDVCADIEARMKNGQQNVGVLCGINAIDSHLFGLEPKTLIYLAGRPSMGKTALALNMARNIAFQGRVLFFSLEMSVEALMRRMIASESNIFLSRLRSGNVEDGQMRRLIQAMDTLSGIDLTILDHPRYKKIESLTAMAEKKASEKSCSAIFVDHIQLIRSASKFPNRHHEISYISNELKSMAKALDAPVVTLCQLSRAVEQQAGRHKKPRLEHMKESGDLEQDADVVIGIYREDRETEAMELGGLKGRDIGTWKDEVNFNRFTQRIADYGS